MFSSVDYLKLYVERIISELLYNLNQLFNYLLNQGSFSILF